MHNKITRRSFLRLAGLGGAVFASGLAGWPQRSMANRGAAGADDFYFVQLSDTHWGFQGPKVNPDAAHTLEKAIAAVNALPHQPDFVIFTGDLTHTTDDPGERRKRLGEFRALASGLHVKTVRFLPGEHDASLDAGQAYQEFFGATHYTFDHKGVHFIVLDNVSDPRGMIGDAQLQWLASDLARIDRKAPVVVFTHRPLFDLYPEWDWATRDGAAAIKLLLGHDNVTVFYGHIHQIHHQRTGHIMHHAAASLIFPLPAPGSMPKRMPVPWDAAHPYRGLDYRIVDANAAAPDYRIDDEPLRKG